MSIAIANQLFLAYLGRPADVQWQSSTAGALNGGQPSVALQEAFYNAAVAEKVYLTTDSPSQLVNKIFQNIFGFGASAFEQQQWGNLISNGTIPPAQAVWTIFTSYLGATNVPAVYQQPVQSKLVAMQAFTTELASNPAENLAYSGGGGVGAVGKAYLDGVTNQATAAAAISSVGPTVDSILTATKYTLTVSSPSVTEGDAGSSSLTYSLTLDRPATEPVTVNFQTQGTGTATAGSDFTPASGAVTFAVGETSKTVNVSVTGDTTFEANETVNVSFTGNLLRNPVTGTGTINNDDVNPATFVRTLTVDAPTVAEGNAGTSNLIFTLTLNQAAAVDTTVNYTTLGTGTATAGTDFNSVSGAVIIPAGQTSTTVTVPVIGDQVFEAAETVNLKFSGALLAADVTATGTINNDDTDPATFVRTLTVDSPSVVEGNAGTSNLVFTLTLNQAAAVDTTINYTTLNTGTATAGADFNTVSGSVTILAGQTSALVTVPVLGEVVFEAAETVNLKFSGALLTADVTATGTINNDDADPAITDQTFTLTEGADQITGLPGGMLGSKGLFTNGANDTIIAGPVNIGGGGVQHTLGAGDLIDGGAGKDTLNLLDGANLLFTPTMLGVEDIFVQNTAGGTTTLNMVNVTGSQSVTLANSIGSLQLTTLKADQAFAVLNSTAVNFDVQTFGPPGGTITDGAFDMTIVSSTVKAGVTTTGADGVGTINLKVGGASNNSFGLSGTDVILNGANTLNVAPDAANPGNGAFSLNGPLDNLNTVNVTFANTTDFTQLATNNNNITFNGGAGTTSVTTGNGSSTITTQGGTDTIIAGNGGNTVNSGAGDDVVTVGAGNDIVNSGDDNDTVNIQAGGTDIVDLGKGNDTVIFGGSLTKVDNLTGGDGTDILVGDLDNFVTATANADVDAVVNGFERLQANGNVTVGQTKTVNLDNIDDIKDVVLNVTTAAQTVVQEVQTFKVTAGTDTTGGLMKLGSTNIELAKNLTIDQVGSAIAAAGVTANQAGEGIQSITYDAATDTVTVKYNLLEGDTTPITVTGDAGVSAKTTATFDATVKVTDGVDQIAEVQTIDLTGKSIDADGGQFTLTPDGGTAVNFTFVGNEGADTVGAAIAARANDIITASKIGGVATIDTVTYDAVTNLVTITYTKAAGNKADIVFTDNAGDKSQLAPVVAKVTDGNPGTSEVQTVKITQGTDADGGVILVNGQRINVAANLTIDQLGVAIVAQQADIIAGDAKIQVINYDTSTDLLTFTYTKAAGVIADNYTTVVDDVGTKTTGATFNAVATPTPGTDGDLAGTVVLDNMEAGGKVTLSGTNLGTIDVNVKVNTAADALNVTLSNSNDHTGSLDVTGFESLAITTQASGGGDNQQVLGLTAPTVTSVTVTGNANINFTSQFAALTTFDGSATGGGAGTNGHIVVTNAGSKATLTGGADDDQLTGGNAGDVINGGAGSDLLVGRGGADTMDGGAGADVFRYLLATDSFGATNDTINGFVAGTLAVPVDRIDFNAISGGVGTYVGEVTSLAQANSALVGIGTFAAVLDTTAGQLYVDVGGNGVIDAADMIINMTGVTDLHLSNFIF